MAQPLYVRRGWDVSLVVELEIKTVWQVFSQLTRIIGRRGWVKASRDHQGGDVGNHGVVLAQQGTHRAPRLTGFV